MVKTIEERLGASVMHKRKKSEANDSVKVKVKDNSTIDIL